MRSFHPWLESLPLDARRALGAGYAEAARRSGAYIVTPEGNEVAIPVLLTPTVTSRAQRKSLSLQAQALLSALCKLTEGLMQDESTAALRAKLFGALTPFERSALDSTWRSAAFSSTCRVDFLVDQEDEPRALELNATIPAMQGYSDIVADALIRSIANVRGLAAKTDSLIKKNGRNSDDLLQSLLEHYQRLGGQKSTLLIAIVARAGDAQVGELLHYATRWQTLGQRVLLVQPEEISIAGGHAEVRGQRPDLFYRHIFARRLEETSTFAKMCLAPESFFVFNPVCSHLEVKGMLGLLAQAASGESQVRLALSDEEQAAIARLPWTRVLNHEATRSPTGERENDLAEFVRTHREYLVLKRSWDYGGKGVFLGTDLDEADTQARLQALLAVNRRVSWSELVDFALSDKDAWVAQALVHAQRTKMVRADLSVDDFYADLSAYTNLGVAFSPDGGVVRASKKRIVNLLGGGGLSPLILDEVLDELLP